MIEESQKSHASFPGRDAVYGIMTDDQTLLRRFAEKQDEGAFTELVNRHLGMVHGICKRRTGDSQLAEELAQNVFFSLARKAGSIRTDVLIAGWLHRASYLASSHALRAEASRKRTMKQFTEVHSLTDSTAPDLPSDLAPVLDEAMDRMSPTDRDILLLRFASGFTLRQIGDSLGKSESASQRHLQRALEKLCGLLRKQGVTVGVGALATFLGTDLAKAAPTTLVGPTISKAAIAHASIGGAATSISLTTIVILMKQKAMIAAAVCLIAAAGSAVYIKNNPSESGSVAGMPKSPVGADRESKGSSDSASSEETGFATKARGERSAGAFPDLAARFGNSRVLLAKTITSDFVLGIEQLTPLLQKLDRENVKPSSLNKAYRQWNGLAEQLALSEEQESALIDQLDKKMKDRLQMLGDAPRSILENREKFLEVLLARDAASRGEFPVEESRALVEESKALFGPLMDEDSEKSFANAVGGEDKLRTILDESQMAKLKELEEKRAQELEANKQSGGNGKNQGVTFSTKMPSLTGSESLEDLADQMQKFKTATGAMSQMLRLEGKDAAPEK
jgi:RNA polymerase sigma factor (sigma-70 family)